MSYKYHIEPITLESVETLGKKRYNSSNHWDNGKPDDYDVILNNTFTKNWIDEFHQHYRILNIDPKDTSWLREASKIGKITGNFPSSFREDLDDLLTKYKNFNFFGEKYFIRSETTSLKYGIHGVGPYTSIKQIIESLVSSTDSHSPIPKSDDSKHIKLYFLPWIEMDEAYEFRIFVHNKRITAISQQNLYKKNKFFDSLLPDERTNVITGLIDKIVHYFNDVITKKICLPNYSYDFVFVNDNPYFIEINGFGKEYAAGSALFHWIIDEQILYGTTNDIYFRYTC